jgi:hypothetical protein
LHVPLRIAPCAEARVRRKVRYPDRALDRKDRVMAAHDTPEYSTATGNDYPAHEQTYLAFLKLVKWGVAVVVAILVLMAYFLT